MLWHICILDGQVLDHGEFLDSFALLVLPASTTALIDVGFHLHPARQKLSIPLYG